jgi:hypothetical protein
MPVSREDGLDVSKRKLEILEGSFEPGIKKRLISTNSDSGGGHMVIEIEKNWSNPKGYCTASQDIYILEGDLTVGNEKMISGCYSFIPKGTAYGPLRSEKGCRALVFFGSPYDFIKSENHLPNSDLDNLKMNLKTWDIPWENAMKDMVEKTTWKNPETGEPDRPSGTLAKVLRWDKNPEEQIALVHQPPGTIDPGTEVHPHNECLYLISGDCYIGYTYDNKNREMEDRKVGIKIKKDYYLSRPPGIFHGPLVTHGGVYWMTYMSDGYHGIFHDVPEWREMSEGYFAEAVYR